MGWTPYTPKQNSNLVALLINEWIIFFFYQRFKRAAVQVKHCHCFFSGCLCALQYKRALFIFLTFFSPCLRSRQNPAQGCWQHLCWFGASTQGEISRVMDENNHYNFCSLLPIGTVHGMMYNQSLCLPYIPIFFELKILC